MSELIRPEKRFATLEGNFYSIGLNYFTKKQIWIPIKTREGKVIRIAIAVSPESSGMGIDTELQFPCVYVVHPSALHDEEYSLSHVLLTIKESKYDTRQIQSEGFVTNHTSCLLPESRRAKPGEPYLVPLVCTREFVSLRWGTIPSMYVTAIDNVHLYSPEIDRYYEETLPTWDVIYENSWDDLRLDIMKGKYSFGYPFVVPDALLYIESHNAPQEFIHYVQTETRKGILRNQRK